MLDQHTAPTVVAGAPPAGDAAPAMVTRGLTKRYDGVEAVADLGVEVRRGRVTGLVGPNGAGKTTAIRMLLGLVEAVFERGMASVTSGAAAKAPLARA